MKRVLVLSFASLITIAVPALAFKVSDTGQTVCYDGVEPYLEIPCEGTGQDGDFTINQTSYNDNGDGTVTDNNTGLIWEQQGGGALGWSASSTACQNLILGGAADWRLPTIQELSTLIVPGFYPTQDPLFGFHQTLWSSTAYIRDTGFKWIADFNWGAIGINAGNVGAFTKRCVRGSWPSFPDLVDFGDGTNLDTVTALIWQADASQEMNWKAALEYCSNLDLGGSANWRLPTVNELNSIFDRTQSHEAYYWTSTNSSPTHARTIFFYDGWYDTAPKTSIQHVRCVHGTNDPPLAAEDTIVVEVDATTSIDVLANDSDPDGDLLTIQSVTQAAHGEVVILDNSVSYTPDTGFFGLDAFTYTISDGNGGSDTATVSIVVAPLFDISGKVMTNLGAPLRRVTMNLLSGGVVIKTAKTGIYGKYRITDVPPDNYVLRPSKTNWYFVKRRRLITISGSNLIMQNFTAYPK